MAKLFPKAVKQELAIEDVMSADSVDIVKLQEQGRSILQREIRNLMGESSKGKLCAGSARDLVAYLKLLAELEVTERAALASMDDDELSVAKPSGN